MKKIFTSVVAMVALGASPLLASAAVDTDSTTINANIGAAISMTTNTTVALTVTPTGAGAASSSSDTVTVSTSNFAFSHTDGGTGKVCGLGYKGLNSSKTAYVFNQSLAVPAGRSKTVILFIDIGPVTTSSFDKFYRGTITITLSKLNNQTATFTFNGLISDPSSTVS